MAYLIKAAFIAYTLTMVLNQVTARPGFFDEFSEVGHENLCLKGNSEVIETCQRCAKQTKSTIVYPMCCKDEEDAFNWCLRYIQYGKQAISKRHLMI